MKEQGHFLTAVNERKTFRFDDNNKKSIKTIYHIRPFVNLIPTFGYRNSLGFRVFRGIV